MRSSKVTSSIGVAVTLLGMAACTTPPYSDNTASYPGTASYPTYPSSPPPPDYRGAYFGYVESVEAIAAESRPSATGIGALGGAIAGGVLGNQIGHGNGRAAATIGGVVAGAAIGHQVEQHVRGNQSAGTAYRFRVRLDDGSYQTFTQETHDNIRVGDRVRVENNHVWPA